MFPSLPRLTHIDSSGVLQKPTQLNAPKKRRGATNTILPPRDPTPRRRVRFALDNAAAVNPSVFAAAAVNPSAVAASAVNPTVFAAAAVNPPAVAAAAENPPAVAASAVNPSAVAASAVNPPAVTVTTVNPVAVTATVHPSAATTADAALGDPEVPLPPESAQFLSDRLGKLVSQAVEMFGCMSFTDLCLQHRGTSCLTGQANVRHPGEPLLRQLRDHGAAVRLGNKPWSLELLDAAVLRGSHRSTQNNIPFVRDEFADMVSAGQWLVLPYSVVRLLPNLRLSPTGLVPQRDRRDRLIVDYSFSGVNQDTLSDAPDSLQFGYALPRLIQKLQRADTRCGPIFLAKIDVADAFMRIPLVVHHVAALGALLPARPGEEPLVAFPLILPMGWIDSPQYLCAVTETIADTANDRLRSGLLSAIQHRLDDLADSKPDPIRRSDVVATKTGIQPPVVQSHGPRQHPLNTVDVYMDDFILLSQLPKDLRQATRRTVFECIDSVLRPLSPSDNPNRKEPNSVKKLAKGDAYWATEKVVLGWLIDTKRRTIELPPHRRDRLHEILHQFPRSQRRTSRKKWQCLIGELRSMVLAIAGGRGLFSQLQSVLTYPNNPQPADRLFLTSAVHDQLEDFRWLADDLANRPTRWGELVDSDPSFYGTVDASGLGMAHMPPQSDVFALQCLEIFSNFSSTLEVFGERVPTRGCLLMPAYTRGDGLLHHPLPLCSSGFGRWSSSWDYY